jgi:Ca2+-binding RTX toxin-like protein
MADDFPADATSAARVIVGSTVTGQIETAGDMDWIGFQARPGGVYRIDLTGAGEVPLADSALQGVFKSWGDYVAGTWDNDGGPGLDSLLTVGTSSLGLHYIAVTGQAGATGGYRLAVTELATINGTTGDDWLLWGPGTGAINGRGGRFDAASFVAASGGVSVNLDRGSAPGMARFDDDSTAPVLLYGIDRVTGSSFEDTLRGDDSDNVLRGLGGDDLIFASIGRDIYDGGAGFDIVSFAYRDDVAGISASLRTDSAGYWGAVAFSTLVGIEGLIGSPGNDSLSGSIGDDFIDGGGGSDRIVGLIAGNDTVIAGGDDGRTVITGGYNRAYHGYRFAVDYAETQVVLRGTVADYSLTGSGLDYSTRILATGFGGSVDMTNVSLLRIGDGAGFVMRNGTLTALARQDAASEAGVRLEGGSVADWLLGEGGNDTLIGNGGGDRLEGGAGDDWIEPGSRTGAADPVSNVIHGGGGLDTVSYAGLAHGIQAQINGFIPGSATVYSLFGSLSCDSPLDHLRGVERIVGTSHDDSFSEGTYYGLQPGGQSWIRALGGNDRLYGSKGADYFDGGAGQDWVDYLRGSYRDFGDGVEASLLRGRGGAGLAEGDRYMNVENLRGTYRDDQLTGDHRANRLDGMEGDDILMGNGGNDRLYGSHGDDIALYAHAQDEYSITRINAATVRVSHVGGGRYDGTDTLLHIEILRFADGDVIL